MAQGNGVKEWTDYGRLLLVWGTIVTTGASIAFGGTKYIIDTREKVNQLEDRVKEIEENVNEISNE